VMRYSQGTGSLSLWMRVLVAALAPCTGLWSRGLCLGERAVCRGGVQTRAEEGTAAAPWVDFFLNYFLLVFESTGRVFYFLPEDKAKCVWLSFYLKGLCFIENYVTTPTRVALNVSVLLHLILIRNSKIAPKGEMKSLQWVEAINKIGYRADVVGESDRGV